MKKLGFTLAEILITMGIIGVVAALAAPALVTSSNNAKIGPQLQKAVSTFETAAEMLLHDEDASGLVGVVSEYNSAGLGKALSKYMKLDGNHNSVGTLYYHSYNGSPNAFNTSHPKYKTFRTDDGSCYIIALENKRAPHSMYQNIPNNQYIGEVYYDINGESAPNKIAKDLFKFAMYNDGTLRPWGSKNGFNRQYPDIPHWDSTDHNCNSSGVADSYAWSCTGSIFDNNMKVIYR